MSAPGEPKVGDWVRLNGSDAIGEVREINGSIDSGPVLAVWFGQKGPYLAFPSDVKETRHRESLVDQEALTVLRKVEWCRYMNALCPICEHGRNHGHAADCQLGRLIGATP